ncbi:MAG: DUF4198 domain-containing protein [Deltaproteobacteria bacterium]|nr:DUF4198 domain-containing protein [Candidatus Tharpella sp.]
MSGGSRFLSPLINWEEKNKSVPFWSNAMKYFVSFFLLIGMFLIPVTATAHTTILIPQIDKNGEKSVKVLHFHPATGSGLMGIRLGVEDTKELKGLESIFLIYEKEEKKLDAVAIPDYYTVRGERRETYTIPVNRESGFLKPGDYVIVVKHKAHWKKYEGLYRQKVAKFCLNYLVGINSWSNRVLKNMPEIIPLVQPDRVSAGTLFRAEAINEEGQRIPHAKINIEYLNYRLRDAVLDTTAAGFIDENIADITIFTDSSGSFSFIPTRAGLWTFTLVDGDSDKLIQGKELAYDSSISILVK